jgi:hypothetical protein
MAGLKNKALGALILLFLTSAANAALLTFTDRSLFVAALPGTATTLDFESQPLGATIGNGSSIDGITFNYGPLPGGAQFAITDGNQFGGGGPFLMTSGTQGLGTDDADLLQDGDGFSLSFATPVNAIGMDFITADLMFDGDITLNAGGASVALSVADAGADLGDGGIPFFLGIIDTGNAFASADILNIGGGFFLYNVDDITTSVIPLPGAAWLFLSGLAGILALRKKTG